MKYLLLTLGNPIFPPIPLSSQDSERDSTSNNSTISNNSRTKEEIPLTQLSIINLNRIPESDNQDGCGRSGQLASSFPNEISAVENTYFNASRSLSDVVVDTGNQAFSPRSVLSQDSQTASLNKDSFNALTNSLDQGTGPTPQLESPDLLNPDLANDDLQPQSLASPLEEVFEIPVMEMMELRSHYEMD